MQYDFVPIPYRKPLKWPNGMRMAVIITTNLEYWEPTKDTELAVEMNENEGTITSSLGPKPYARNVACKAEVPEFKVKQ